jgi:hypothetical protein
MVWTDYVEKTRLDCQYFRCVCIPCLWINIHGQSGRAPSECRKRSRKSWSGMDAPTLLFFEFQDTGNKLEAELCGEKKEKDYVTSSTSENDNRLEETDSGAEIQGSDSNDDTEKKTATFESQTVQTLECTRSLSSN